MKKSKIIVRYEKTGVDDPLGEDVPFYTFRGCQEIWRDKKTAISQAKKFYGVELYEPNQ